MPQQLGLDPHAKKAPIPKEKVRNRTGAFATANTIRTSVPKNWPSDIPYLRQPTHSPAIAPELLSRLNTPTRATAALPKHAHASLPQPNPSVAIARIDDLRHPANRECGLFATTNLLPGSLIVPYVGHLHTDSPADSDPDSRYDISLDRELGLSVDAAAAGNEARFVNDFRHIADGPNAEFRDFWVRFDDKGGGDAGPARWERWVGVFVLPTGKSGLRRLGIRRGDEILVSYGKGFWSQGKGGNGKSGHVASAAEEGEEEEEKADQTHTQGDEEKDKPVTPTK